MREEEMFGRKQRWLPRQQETGLDLSHEILGYEYQFLSATQMGNNSPRREPTKETRDDFCAVEKNLMEFFLDRSKNFSFPSKDEINLMQIENSKHLIDNQR